MTFYTTHCPRCNVLKAKLDKANFVYDTCEDLDTMLALGIQSAPALKVGEKIMNFKEAIDWLKVNPYAN